jgi:hypothetical protein
LRNCSIAIARAVTAPTVAAILPRDIFSRCPASGSRPSRSGFRDLLQASLPNERHASYLLTIKLTSFRKIGSGPNSMLMIPLPLPAAG